MSKANQRNRRHARVRAKVSGTARTPRLSVFRSNKHVYAQLIDDEKGHTLASVTDLGIQGTQNKAMKERAKRIGLELAKKAKAKKIPRVVFDRGGFKYTGSVKALADAAREGGLKF